MVSTIEKINTKIEKLLQQKREVEEIYVTSIAKLISDSLQKGIDIQVFAGLILEAPEIIKESSSKMEAWQIAGRKFLSRSKTRSSKKKTPKNQSTAQTI